MPPARSGAAEAVPVPRGVRGRAGQGLESFAAFLGCFPLSPSAACPAPTGPGPAGRGAPRDAAATTPPGPSFRPPPPPRPPESPLDWAGGGLIRLTTFLLGGGRGRFWGCVEVVRVLPSPPRKAPAHGGPGLAPEGGSEGPERGLPWPRLRAPPRAGAGSHLGPAGASAWAGVPRPPPPPQGRLASAGRGLQPAGPAAGGRDRLSGPYPARAVPGLGPSSLSCPPLEEPSCAHGSGSGWGGGVPVRCRWSPGLKMKGSFFSGKRTSGSCEVSPLENPPTRFTPHR